MSDLFDLQLRAMRRDRAARLGVEPFLYRHAFEDCLERLALVGRRFDHGLLLGCLDPAAARQLAERVGHLDVRDPSALLAQAAGGKQLTEEAWQLEPSAYDLIVTLGTLDTVNALPLVLRSLNAALKPDSFLLGVMPGGETLPRLRAALRCADALEGAAHPHVHPRIAAAALAPLLTDAGFVRPVVDVDRVQVGYPALDRLIGDLRAMGATNVLTERPRHGLTRRALAEARADFTRAGDGKRTVESFELLHFAAWSPENPRGMKSH